jgi:hypothetical protein
MLLLENDAPREYGCLMGYCPENIKSYFVKFAKTAIPEEDLYIDPNDPSFGYEEDPHVTVKYGFKPDLTKQDLAKILQGAKPFTVTFKALNLFENEKFDVVKFEVEPVPQLLELRRKCDQYKNEDTYPEYKPHSTVAYVKKGKFKTLRENLNIPFPISRFKYSGADGRKLMINL